MRPTAVDNSVHRRRKLHRQPHHLSGLVLEEEVLLPQVRGGLAGVEIPSGFVLAYEPVWAIGTGIPATGPMANEAIGLIRQELTSLYGRELAEAARIQYGGSVTPDNIAEFMSQPQIDGALVGGASLKAEAFASIVGQAAQIKGAPAA